MLSHWEITKHTEYRFNCICWIFLFFFFFFSAFICREKSHAVVQMLFLMDFFLHFLIFIVLWFSICNNGFFQQWNRNRFNSLFYFECRFFFFNSPPDFDIIKMLKEPWRHGCGMWTVGQCGTVGIANSSIAFVYAVDWIRSCELISHNNFPLHQGNFFFNHSLETNPC